MRVTGKSGASRRSSRSETAASRCGEAMRPNIRSKSLARKRATISAAASAVPRKRRSRAAARLACWSPAAEAASYVSAASRSAPADQAGDARAGGAVEIGERAIEIAARAGEIEVDLER